MSKSDFRAEETLGLSGKDLVPPRRVPFLESVWLVRRLGSDLLRSVFSGRRSRPISLATKLGVLLPGELHISDEVSVAMSLELLVPVSILTRMLTCNFQDPNQIH